MQQKVTEKLKQIIKNKWTWTAFVLLAVLLLVGIMLVQPHRSVTAYCNIYKSENTRIYGPNGSTLLTNSSTNFHDLSVAFGRLDKVAPTDIEPDVRKIKTVFDQMEKNPSQVFAIGIGGLSAESSVQEWTTDHCGR